MDADEFAGESREKSNDGYGTGGGSASGDCFDSDAGRGWGDSSGSGEGYCVGSSLF